MPSSRAEHARRLRQSVIAFALQAFPKEYREAHGREFPGIEPPSAPVPDRPWQAFLETLVFGGGWRPRGAVVAAFLARSEKLPKADRALLEAWTDAPDGFFRLSRDGGKLKALSLVSEAEYPLAVEAAPNLPDGIVLSCILYAAGEGEYAPGHAQGVSPDKAEEMGKVLETALGVQMLSPPRAFRDNPGRAERSRAVAAARRAFFFETFRGDEARGPGTEIAASYARFRAGWLAKEPAPVLYPDMALESLQASILEAKGAAMVMDGRGELFVLPDWADFLDACKAGAAEEPQRQTAGLYLVNAVAVAPLWERALRLHPEGTRAALARLVEPSRVEEFAAQIPAHVEARAKLPPCVALGDPGLAGALPSFLAELAKRQKEEEEARKAKEGPKLWVPGAR
ncbi:MAG: hypothetical protein MUC63_00585 [Planctomycetes bacterium]|nr:hypothetical protein [Planctomycetota bacterium]